MTTQWVNANKDHVYQIKKKWVEDNREHTQSYMKAYKEHNKESIDKQRKQPYVCCCGAEIHRMNKAKHEKTNKHLNFLKNNNIIYIDKHDNSK